VRSTNGELSDFATAKKPRELGADANASFRRSAVARARSSLVPVAEIPTTEKRCQLKNMPLFCSQETDRRRFCRYPAAMPVTVVQSDYAKSLPQAR
jgi:hypothetical protein